MAGPNSREFFIKNPAVWTYTYIHIYIYIYIYILYIIHVTWAIKRSWEDCNDQHNSQHHAMVPKRLCAQAKIWLASAIFLVMSFLDTYSPKKPFSMYIDILYIYIILYQYRYIFGGVFVSTEFPIFWYILVVNLSLSTKSLDSAGPRMSAWSSCCPSENWRMIIERPQNIPRWV